MRENDDDNKYLTLEHSHFVLQKINKLIMHHNKGAHGVLSHGREICNVGIH